MWTHRWVKQQELGRPLLAHEKVHHINGHRDDNRPENLELWDRTHPSGVRLRDRMKRYTTEEIEAELARRRRSEERDAS